MKPFDALTALHGVRDVLYKCFDRRSHALFELADAIVAADIVPSPVHLSLKPVHLSLKPPSHRRAWGSLYDALSRGRIDLETFVVAAALGKTRDQGCRLCVPRPSALGGHRGGVDQTDYVASRISIVNIAVDSRPCE
jgi:hypothetical protein